MKKTIFYLVGCPVCAGAEYDILSLIGKDQVEVVYLGGGPFPYRAS